MVEADRRRLLQARFQGCDSGCRGRVCTESVTRLAKLKKADIASEAERLADGTGWMPAIFKAAGPQNAAQEAGPEQDAPEDAEAMADEPAEALAA